MATDDTVTLTDEDGTEHDFTIIDVIGVNDREYAVLLPLNPCDPSEEDAVILRIEEEDGDDVLVEIEDEAEWEAVCAAWDAADEDEADDIQ